MVSLNGGKGASIPKDRRQFAQGQAESIRSFHVLAKYQQTWTETHYGNVLRIIQLPMCLTGTNRLGVADPLRVC